VGGVAKHGGEGRGKDRQRYLRYVPARQNVERSGSEWQGKGNIQGKAEKMEVKELIKIFEDLKISDIQKMDGEELMKLINLLQDLLKITLLLKKQAKIG
jgi:hypothetical protein